jgi:hypothetical protein
MSLLRGSAFYVAQFRPEAPWKLSPGFNLGGRVLSSAKSEGLPAGEDVDGIVNGGLSVHNPNPSFCRRRLRVSHRSFRPGALLNGQPRLKPGLSFQGPSGRNAPSRDDCFFGSPIIHDFRILTSDPVFGRYRIAPIW